MPWSILILSPSLRPRLRSPAVSPVALFDLDNTLVDRNSVFRRWAEWFVETRGLAPDDVEWLIAADDDGHAARDELFAKLRAHRGLTEGVGALISDYHRDYPLFFAPDPDVCAALTRLRDRGWHIAIVTNGAAVQHTKVARAGLVDLVDACCVSAELGSWKPDREIFEHALTTCGGGDFDFGTTWMVGDSPEHDMAGARALGMRTVWIHRDREWAIGDFEPDYRARSIPEAVDILLADHPVLPA
jgi:FMN phosphatase YigB (HAD superfamily)